MIRRDGAFLLLALLTAISAFAQTNTPIYRVPCDYAYFTAEKAEMPTYSSEAQNQKIGGDVVLIAQYSLDGKVEAVERVLGETGLADASIQAVKNWKFHPIKEKGQQAKGVTYIGFHFMADTGKIANSFPFGNWKTANTTTIADKVATVRLRSGVVAQNKIGGENPRYPEGSKQSRIEGKVELRAIIDREGHISLLEVAKAPSKDLAVASIEAVKTWEYKPYLLNGQPVAVETVVVINYELRG